MTKYAIQRKDGYYYCPHGYTAKEYHARTYDTMTEAELVILAKHLTEHRVVAVDVD